MPRSSQTCSLTSSTQLSHPPPLNQSQRANQVLWYHCLVLHQRTTGHVRSMPSPTHWIRHLSCQPSLSCHPGSSIYYPLLCSLSHSLDITLTTGWFHQGQVSSHSSVKHTENKPRRLHGPITFPRRSISSCWWILMEKGRKAKRNKSDRS